MENKQLYFPGAIVQMAHKDPEIKTLRGITYGIDPSRNLAHFYGSVAAWDAGLIDPVPITPEILERLEGWKNFKIESDSPKFIYFDSGQNRGYYFLQQIGAHWVYKDSYGQSWACDDVHTLQNRFFLDTGIMLKLKK